MDENLMLTYSILIVDSDVKRAQYIKVILEFAFSHVQIFIAETPDVAFESMKHVSIDLFIIEPYLNGAKYNGADFAADLLAKDHLSQVIFQSDKEDLKYRVKLHKKFTHSPYILRSSLTYDQELKDNVRYALDFAAMIASRKLVFVKKAKSFIFDVREIEYIYKIPNEKAIAVHYLDQVTHQFKSVFVPNVGLTHVFALLDVKQDLIRVEDKHVINPLMLREVDHSNGEIIMKSGARINIGKTYRQAIGVVLNALKR